ncbi:HEAT repeat domain-containing protein [Pyxidicoccus xibeiensis]|uniref:HEAT repeat domain-containing protein n=1 Tax=Pyxidicoccus xibeiensis TaxID=2906759 RepID=UPI0020A73AF4|nr:HEAT repeat domain-containing protein [Pyxidicoccus xibeiensis]MCP3136323.1 HEAT repeat domain-containing protein [Pyxidicoccus xibeiensis]
MKSTPPSKHRRVAAVVLAVAALLAAAGLLLSRTQPTPTATPPVASSRDEELPEPPLPALPEPGQRASRAVYRVEHDLRFTLDISKMASGLDPNAKQQVTTDNAKTEVVTKVSGLLEWRPVPGAEGRWVRLRWKDTGSRSTYPGSGMSAQDEAFLSEQQAKLLDGAEAFVQLDPRNKVLGVKVAPELKPQALPQLFNVLELMAASVPGRPPEEWNAEEHDSFGRYNGAYKVEARDGQTLLVGKTKHYQELHHASPAEADGVGLREKDVKTMGKARIRFSLEERRVLAVEARFRTQVRHPLMDSDVEETYSVQPAGLEAFADTAPPSSLEEHLVALRDVDPRRVAEAARSSVTARPGTVGLEPAEVERKLVELMAALRRLPRFDPQAEDARPLLKDLVSLFSSHPAVARQSLLPVLTDLKDPVPADVLSAVVAQVVGLGVEGQTLALNVLASKGMPEEGYAAALQGIGTQDTLEWTGRDALLQTLRGEMLDVPAEIAVNAALLVGHQGRLAKERGEDVSQWQGALVDALARAKDPERQELALLGLGNIGEPATLALAERYLDSPDANVRLAAASALRQVADPQAAHRIFSLFMSDPSVEVRLGVVDLFNELAPLDAVMAQALQAMPGQPDPAVRRKTLAVLAERSRSPQFVSAFLGDPDPTIRALAQEYLGRL